MLQLKVMPSKNTQPFHDGMNEEKAELKVECSHCKLMLSENLVSSISKGEDWYSNLTEANQQSIATAFGYSYKISEPFKIASAKLPNGHSAYFCKMNCENCAASTLVAVDFYEKQPMRFIAAITAVAQLEKRS